MKKILLVNPYAAPPNYSSLGFRHFFLSKEWVKMGYQVTVLASAYDHYMYKFPSTKKIFNSETIDGVNFIFIKNFKYKNSYGLGRILNWIIFTLLLLVYNPKQKFDIIICSSPDLFSFIPCFFKKLINKSSKLILEIRDIWPLTIIELGNKSKYNPLIFILSLIEKFSYENSDLIVGTMGNLDNHIKKIINKKINFRYIPQGVDLDFLKDSAKFDISLLQKFPIKSKLVIGYAGSMSVSNSLETIIKAAKIIEKSHPEINFYFLGDGMEKKKLISLSNDLQNVYFFDKVDKKYVLSFLKKCDVLYDSVNYSKIYDFGISRNKWMDYMYASKPLLISYNGFEDIVSKLKNGYTVNSQDINDLVHKILKINKTKTHELKSMGATGKNYVIKNRTFKILATNYHKLF